MTKHFGRYKLFPLLKYMINRHTIWQPARHCNIEPYEKYVQEEFEDTTGVIIIRISKKNRQHNSQKTLFLFVIVLL